MLIENENFERNWCSTLTTDDIDLTFLVESYLNKSSFGIVAVLRDGNYQTFFDVLPQECNSLCDEIIHIRSFRFDKGETISLKKNSKFDFIVNNQLLKDLEKIEITPKGIIAVFDNKKKVGVKRPFVNLKLTQVCDQLTGSF